MNAGGRKIFHEQRSPEIAIVWVCTDGDPAPTLHAHRRCTRASSLIMEIQLNSWVRISYVANLQEVPPEHQCHDVIVKPEIKTTARAKNVSSHGGPGKSLK